MEQEDLVADVEQAIADARELEANQRHIAARALLGSLVMRITLYVVGLVLMAALFGLALPPLVTAVLGAIAIVVTILGQQFRPDVKFINAKGHVLQLSRTITTVEKALAAVRAGQPAAWDLPGILKHVRGMIGEVERNHHLDYAIMRERIVSMMPRDSGGADNA